MHYKLIACWRNSVQWLLSMQLPPLAGCVSFQMACSSLCSAAFWEVYQTFSIHADVCGLLITRGPINNFVLQFEINCSASHAAVQLALIFFANSSIFWQPLSRSETPRPNTQTSPKRIRTLQGSEIR